MSTNATQTEESPSVTREALEEESFNDLRQRASHLIDEPNPSKDDLIDALLEADEDERDPPAETDGGTAKTETDTDPGFSTIIDADTFVTFLDHINALVDEAKMHWTEDGVNVRAVDAANVAMVDTNLKASAFESYDLPDEELLGVNTTRLADVVGAADSGDLLSIKFDARKRVLVVRHGGHEFTLALIDPDSIRQEPDVPELDLPVMVSFDAGLLKTAIKFSDQVSDHVQFRFEPDPDGDAFVVEATGDTDDYEGTFTEDDGVEFTQIADTTVRSLYSLDYLKDSLNSYNADRQMTLRLGDEFPTRYNAPIMDPDDGDVRVGNAAYMLAPRIQSE